MFNKTIDSIIQNAYTLFLLDEHFTKPSYNTRLHLDSQNIDPNLFFKYKHLISYNVKFLRTGELHYDLLRKGLQEYYENELFRLFPLLGLKNLTVNFLDFGCGSGVYADDFLKYNPSSKVFAVDVDISGVCNKENKTVLLIEKDWHIPYLNKFDFILLCEVLHNKTYAEKIQIIELCFSLLSPKGCLIIGENSDTAMAYRISKSKKRDAPIITGRFLNLLVNKETIWKPLNINNHTFYMYGNI